MGRLWKLRDRVLRAFDLKSRDLGFKFSLRPVDFELSLSPSFAWSVVRDAKENCTKKWPLDVTLPVPSFLRFSFASCAMDLAKEELHVLHVPSSWINQRVCLTTSALCWESLKLTRSEIKIKGPKRLCTADLLSTPVTLIVFLSVGTSWVNN